MPWADAEVRERVGRIDVLLEEMGSLPEPARSTTEELARALVELYGEGLARIVDHLASVDGGQAHRGLDHDELVSHLLLLHGLHPLDPGARVDRAVGAARVELGLREGDVELVGVERDAARLRLRGKGCASTQERVKGTLDQAVRAAAPEIDEVVFEDAAPEPALIPVASLRQRIASGEGRAVRG